MVLMSKCMTEAATERAAGTGLKMGVLLNRIGHGTLAHGHQLFGKRLQVVHLLREPLETVLSEYHYARVTAPAPVAMRKPSKMGCTPMHQCAQ